MVEVLAVVTIILILAAILFPVVSQAKSRGKVAGCLSNLRQLDFAHRQYTIDHDGWASPNQPGWLDYSGIQFSAERWWVAIQPYAKANNVRYCPSDPEPGLAHRSGINYVPAKAFATYTVPWGNPWDLSFTEPPSLMVDFIREPATTVYMQDMQLAFRDPKTNNTIVRTHHGETMSFIYWDGHAVHKPDPWLAMQRPR